MCSGEALSHEALLSPKRNETQRLKSPPYKHPPIPAHPLEKSKVLLPKPHSSTIVRFLPLTMSLTNADPGEAAKSARSASHVLAALPTAARNVALTAIHSVLVQSKEEILAANARDLELAKKAADEGKLSLSLVSRLDLKKKGKWEDMLKGILDVRELEDPGKSKSLCLNPQLANRPNQSAKSHYG
jgi:glutamate-5-semialdehyde dehydrogenase